MDFFEQQDRARRNTAVLVLLLVLAVASLIAITTIAVAILMYVFEVGGPRAANVDGSGEMLVTSLLTLVDWPLISAIASVIVAVVVAGSFYKLHQFARGGSAVAEALGGRQINTDTRDTDERKILNVVEEMAIASGTPVPPVYVINDPSINAFAAGHSPQDAVIGITRGAIRILSRDELQGVVAHEFSHIFHGDMRLNLRLASLLHGILLIGLIGNALVRSVRYRPRRSSKRDNSPAAILSIGAALMVIGYAGTFFGSLIKAAVSRQREFLADASAVQFTRDPEGIGGALKKIGGYTAGSRLAVPNAAEFSHMFFGQGVRQSFGGLMATHPPLGERIRRVLPHWDGRFAPVELPTEHHTAEQRQERKSDLHLAAAAGVSSVAQAAAHAVDAIGQPQPQHLAYARRMLEGLDERLSAAAHDPFSARALVYGLLLNSDEVIRSRQLQVVEQNASVDESGTLAALEERLRELDPAERLPLIELALPALKQLSRPQFLAFKRCLVALIKADAKVSLMEWALYRIVVHNTEPRKAVVAQRRQLGECAQECLVLLSIMAYAGHGSAEHAQNALTAAGTELPFGDLRLIPREEVNLAALETAVSRLGELKPLQKPQLLKALARCVEHDGRVTVIEAELFRAVADTLDCPMPPLLVD